MSLRRAGLMCAGIRLAAVGTVMALGLGAAPGAEGATLRAPSAVKLSTRPVGADPGWKRYVLDQKGPLVYPRHAYVVGASAQVSNPAGLTRPGAANTTLSSRSAGDVRLVLDLGINAGGYVELGITKNSGTTVRLGYSEARRYLTSTGDTGLAANQVGVPFVTDPSLGNDDDPGGRYDDFAGTGALRSPAVRGAERWISIELEGPGSVTLDYVRVRGAHLHPAISDYVGHFLSSDTQLNRIWYAGVYTFTLDSFKDLRPGFDKGNVVVTDGAKRDRLAWLGDLAVENLLGDYALRQAPRVIRDTLALFSCQQGSDGQFPANSQISTSCPATPPAPSGPVVDQIPEYTAWWVVGVHDYELMSGDDAFARRMMPDVRRALGFFTSNLDANGLYSTPAAATNWHPFDTAGGEDTHTNAVIYRALTDGADLERRLGNPSAGRMYARAASSLRAAMLAHLWDPAAGAFLLNASDGMGNHSEDAQVEPVLDGVITGARALSALSFVERHLDGTYGVATGQFADDPYMSDYISPYIGSTDLLARLAAGQTRSALSLLRREWGHMVDTDPGTTLWEKMAFNGDPATYSPNQLGAGGVPDNNPAGRGIASLAHGWAGGPVPALSGYIAGIRPLSPGFRTWVVAPYPGNLRWAQAQAPGRRGPIVARWRRGSGSFVLTAGGPRGTSGVVVMPLLGRDRTIARDGRVVWDHGRPSPGVRAHRVGDTVVFAAAGVHTYAWR